jgi:hypothetical protein
VSNVEIIDTFFFATNFVDDSILIVGSSPAITSLVGWRLVHNFLIFKKPNLDGARANLLSPKL